MEEVPGVRQEAVHIPDDIPSFYVNGVATAFSLYDMALICKLAGPRTVFGSERSPDIQEKPVCIVRMSPEHAKILGAIIVHAVKNYEKELGIQLATDPDRKDLMNEVYGS